MWIPRSKRDLLCRLSLKRLVSRHEEAEVGPAIAVTIFTNGFNRISDTTVNFPRVVYSSSPAGAVDPISQLWSARIQIRLSDTFDPCRYAQRHAFKSLVQISRLTPMNQPHVER